MNGEHLTIDIAVYGNTKDPTNIIFYSSGVHGVEGFAGSAIQLKVLSELLPSADKTKTVFVFIHSMNPFGMSWLRRWNENNIDLNRNSFWPTSTAAKECQSRLTDPAYHALNWLLNPIGLAWHDPVTYWMWTAWSLIKHGFTALKQAIASGQGKYPRGVFFGGEDIEQGPKKVLDWLEEFFGTFTSTVKTAVVVDLHTGLGPQGEDTLLTEGVHAPKDEFKRHFGTRVQFSGGPDAAKKSIAYDASGDWKHAVGDLIEGTWKGARVFPMTQEFGTYNPIKTFYNLRRENAMWQKYGKSLPKDHPAKLGVRGVFYLDHSTDWKAKVLKRGGQLFQDALRCVAE
eukprot:TRINITY_DN66963_c5_g3_i1.p1 TRINITY_DN66963_c5_g3~~TRINITY_DN66963_c5_g3_i1.p1  ORF type:complete len:396 (+),score=25.45 TRINITY_DN66963_c5_g3_i1:164-1189(+)